MLKSYFSDLFMVLARPIYFFSNMPEGEWSDKPVTFAGITAAILSFFVTIIVFITQYIPIGATLLEKVALSKYIIVSPVMAVLAFTFFVITYSITFGLFLVLILLLFWLLAVLLYYTGNLLAKGPGDYLKYLKASFYSSAVVIAFILPILFVILTKNRLMDFTNYVVGYNIIYSLVVLFLYGLEAIIARKAHGLKKWKAFVSALVPLLFMVIVGILANKVILPKIMPWIM